MSASHSAMNNIAQNRTQRKTNVCLMTAVGRDWYIGSSIQWGHINNSMLIYVQMQLIKTQIHTVLNRTNWMKAVSKLQIYLHSIAGHACWMLLKRIWLKCENDVLPRDTTLWSLCDFAFLNFGLPGWSQTYLNFLAVFACNDQSTRRHLRHPRRQQAIRPRTANTYKTPTQRKFE